MGQVISRVYELIEQARQKKISTRIDEKGVSDISDMLKDIDNFTQQELGRPFSELKCEEVNLAFLNFYKKSLIKRGHREQSDTFVSDRILSLHSVFNFVDAYNVANMDIDMFEYFLDQTKEEGLIRIEYIN